MRAKFGIGGLVASGARSTHHLPLGKRSPVLRSLALILCKSQVQDYLSVLWNAIKQASSFILISLQFLDTWLNSQKDNERERAMWCAARILGFTAKMKNFEVSKRLP